MACTSAGFVPDDLELWQIGASLGVHRPDRHRKQPADPFATDSAPLADPNVRAMKAAVLARQRGQDAPPWMGDDDEGTDAELIDMATRRPPDA